jgi:hypothetical protein
MMPCSIGYFRERTEDLRRASKPTKVVPVAPHWLLASLNFPGKSFVTPTRVGTMRVGKHSLPVEISAEANPILVVYVPRSTTRGLSTKDEAPSLLGFLRVISSPSFSSYNFIRPFGLTACLIFFNYNSAYLWSED